MQPERAQVHPDETLFVQPRKRFVPTWGKGESGGQELTLHVGLKEFCFDEPDLFPWAQKLMEQDSFLAGSAVSWTGQPIEWPRIKEILETFVEEGVIARTPPPGFSNTPSARHIQFLKDDAERRAFETPRSWNPDSDQVIREITGMHLPQAYLESAMPVNLLAHTAVDREGRQVGEINAFPDMMRLRLQTDWKTCNYAGSRYRHDLPMNMTALRSMLSNWTPVLRSVLLVREEFTRRFPQPGPAWKMGEVLFASYSVLCTVSYQVTRRDKPVRTGELSPVLSSMFRVVDGIRMISGFLLDVIEHPRFHDTPTVWKDIVEAAETEDQYRSARGVCAGPQNMIEELVQTLLDGKPVTVKDDTELSPDWVSSIPEGVDYGLLGLQINACIMMVWVRLGLAVASIHEALLRHPELKGGKLDLLRTVIERDFVRLRQGRNVLPAQRDLSEIYYANIYDHVQPGIRGLAEKDRKRFADEMNPPASLLGDGARGALRDLFGSLGEPAESAALLQEISGYVFDYVRYERNALRPIADIQRQINTLLGRPQAQEPLTGQHLGVGPALRRATFDYGPNSLTDTIREALGIGIENSQDETTVTYGGRSFSLR